MNSTNQSDPISMTWFRIVVLFVVISAVFSVPIDCNTRISLAFEGDENILEQDITLAVDPCGDKHVCVIKCPPCGKTTYFDIGQFVNNYPRAFQSACVDRVHSLHQRGFAFSELFFKTTLLNQLKTVYGRGVDCK